MFGFCLNAQKRCEATQLTCPFWQLSVQKLKIEHNFKLGKAMKKHIFT
jgi:hypothetical protein